MCAVSTAGAGDEGDMVFYTSVFRNKSVYCKCYTLIWCSIFEDMEMVIFLSHLRLRLPAGLWGAGGAQKRSQGLGCEVRLSAALAVLGHLPTALYPYSSVCTPDVAAEAHFFFSFCGERWSRHAMEYSTGL